MRKRNLHPSIARRHKPATNRREIYGDTHWDTSTAGRRQQALEANRAGNGLRAREDSDAGREGPAFEIRNAHAPRL